LRLARVAGQLRHRRPDHGIHLEREIPRRGMDREIRLHLALPPAHLGAARLLAHGPGHAGALDPAPDRAEGEAALMLAFFPEAWRIDPRASVVGGLLAAVVTLPLSMGLGALALAPFGPEYVTRGVLAGLYAAAFLGLAAIMMGARGVAIYAPRSLVSFMIASVSADLFLQARWLPRDPDAVMAAIFLLL